MSDLIALVLMAFVAGTAMITAVFVVFIVVCLAFDFLSWATMLLAVRHRRRQRNFKNKFPRLFDPKEQ